jgi:predicted nucleic acid-binding protein
LAAELTPANTADTAHAPALTLVTHNTSEFGRISGLALEDWELP